MAQQLREATPYDQAPRFLIRDNDGKFGSDFAAAADGARIDVVTIPPQSPNLNAICERFLGGLRRECLDHVLILGEDHLRRILAEWVTHYNGGRPHQGIGQRIPRRAAKSDTSGHVVVNPVLGGLITTIDERRRRVTPSSHRRTTEVARTLLNERAGATSTDQTRAESTS